MLGTGAEDKVMESKLHRHLDDQEARQLAREERIRDLLDKARTEEGSNELAWSYELMLTDMPELIRLAAECATACERWPYDKSAAYAAFGRDVLQMFMDGIERSD